MKHYKYFAITENDAEEYFSRKQALKDLVNFGKDEEVKLYSLNKDNNFDCQNVTSEDLIGIYKNGKLVKPNAQFFSRYFKGEKQK